MNSNQNFENEIDSIRNEMLCVIKDIKDLEEKHSNLEIKYINLKEKLRLLLKDKNEDDGDDGNEDDNISEDENVFNEEENNEELNLLNPVKNEDVETKTKSKKATKPKAEKTVKTTKSKSTKQTDETVLVEESKTGENTEPEKKKRIYKKKTEDK